MTKESLFSKVHKYTTPLLLFLPLGYQTAKTSELRDILAKARHRTDNSTAKMEHHTSMA